ncbi:hypothetical protein K466DRAFT_570498 [Polyporus arcularius HHB13444]|uniref:Uncharacterized protein n=1 Tax=Polyporus arcularius HHB13444 TaxID=1314778 RepID=A0A5C3NP30_9APHY|nr:hypothetical protein K466DRAFT_570498 [Polyporus arcularius HHB13444]
MQRAHVQGYLAQLVLRQTSESCGHIRRFNICQERPQNSSSNRPIALVLILSACEPPCTLLRRHGARRSRDNDRAGWPKHIVKVTVKLTVHLSQFILPRDLAHMRERVHDPSESWRQYLRADLLRAGTSRQAAVVIACVGGMLYFASPDCSDNADTIWTEFDDAMADVVRFCTTWAPEDRTHRVLLPVLLWALTSCPPRPTTFVSSGSVTHQHSTLRPIPRPAGVHGTRLGLFGCWHTQPHPLLVDDPAREMLDLALRVPVLPERVHGTPQNAPRSASMASPMYHFYTAHGPVASSPDCACAGQLSPEDRRGLHSPCVLAQAPA